MIDALNYKIFYKLLILILILIYNYRKSIKIKNRISIIVPTYNREKLITLSIRSALNQTHNNIELLIIDDCSDDNTEKEIDKIKDERLRYIKLRKNLGANYARNLGIKKATGEYITFLDSDDLFRYNKLEKQLNNLKKYKSNLDFCKICIHINNEFNFSVPNKIQEKKIMKGKIYDELSNGNFISTQAILLKNSNLQKFLFDINLPRLQDYDFILRIIPNAKVSFTKEVLVDIYIQKDSISYSLPKLERAVKILLNKNYTFNNIQKKNFVNYLNYLLKSKIFNI